MCIFTLPTPPLQQNCHSHNFLDQLRAFPPPFGQSPSVLPITQDFCLESWPGTMGHLLIRKWFALSSYYEPSVALLLLAPNSVLPLLFYSHASCYRGETPIIVSTIAFSEDTSRLPVCFLTTFIHPSYNMNLVSAPIILTSSGLLNLNGRHIRFLRDNSRSLPFSSPCNLFHS